MSKNKYSLFPVQHQDLWDAYKDHVAMLWTVEELDFTQDQADFDNLSQNEKHFLMYILAFFSQSDGIVNENLVLRFYNDVDLAEARAFYTAQMMIETIHAETYGLLIDTYVKSEAEKDRLFNAIETIPTVKRKGEWILKWISSEESFAKRLIAFAIVEGVFFSGSFCAIFWFRKRGILPGLAAANDLISRDEGLHWVFATKLFIALKLEISQSEFEQILISAVEIEKEFILEALPVDLIGMSSEKMEQYIEYVSDRLALSFGMKKVFNTKNPFSFMVLIDLENKTNFFEKRVTEYQKAGKLDIGFDDDF